MIKEHKKKEIIVPVKIYVDQADVVEDHDENSVDIESNKAGTLKQEEIIFDPIRDIPTYKHIQKNMNRTPEEKKLDDKKLLILWTGVISIGVVVFIGWGATLKYSDFFRVKLDKTESYEDIQGTIKESYKDFTATMFELQKEVGDQASLESESLSNESDDQLLKEAEDELKILLGVDSSADNNISSDKNILDTQSE